MRLINKLHSQHLGWTFKKHWSVQSKRIPCNTGAEKDLKPKDVMPENTRSNKKIINSADLSPFLKNRKMLSKPCYIYGNNNVLIGGLQQALSLTKSIEIRCLPKRIETIRVHVTGLMEANIKEAVMTSNLFFHDKAKLLEKRSIQPPTYKLSQDYDIPNERKISTLICKLLTECEKNVGRNINSQRRVVDLMNFKVTVPKHGSLLQFEMNAQKMITSSSPLESIKNNFDSYVPDLHYIRDTISLQKQFLYSDDSTYSLPLKYCHPHTIFIYLDKNKVKNIHDGDVSISQFQSRNMLIAFTVAAARAKQLYGDAALNNLPKPVVVQSIQTDGRSFHFGVFQLNTLQIENVEGPKNVWFHKPNEDIFQICKYSSGQPFLEGLNNNVFRYICAFYKNF